MCLYKMNPTTTAKMNRKHRKTLTFVRVVEYEVKITEEDFVSGKMKEFPDANIDLDAITREQRQKIWDEMCKKSAGGVFEDTDREPDHEYAYTTGLYEKAACSAWDTCEEKKKEMNQRIIEAVYHPDRVEKMMDKFGGDYLDEIEGVEY